VLRKGGRLVCYGVSSAYWSGDQGPAGRTTGKFAALLKTFPLLGWYKVVPDGRTASFYGIGESKVCRGGTIQDDLARVLAWRAEGKLGAPVIGAKFPLERASEAHQLLGAGGTSGKILLVHGD
jgi:NADPH2:quinone reductase